MKEDQIMAIAVELKKINPNKPLEDIVKEIIASMKIIKK